MNGKTRHVAAGLVIAAAVGMGLSYFVSRKVRARHFGLMRKIVGAPTVKCQQILVVQSALECENAVKVLYSKCSEFRVLGFDCEWVTSKSRRHPVALLQLASHDGICTLIRLCKMETVPLSLKELLADKSILKVGVGPVDDAANLLKDHGLEAKGCLDLRHLVMRHRPASKLVEKMGLSGLASQLLGVQLDKHWKIRCSDWEAEVLSDRQVNYAAMDAVVAVKIFEELVREKIIKHWWLWGESSMEIWKQVLPLCQGIIDVRFKLNQFNSSPESSNKVQKLLQTFKAKDPSRSYSTRKKPLYDNCYLQAPDGEVLCSCEMSKAKWYVSKDLGEVVCEAPYTVRLNFEPSGRAVGEIGKYYVQEKDNLCVVCGRTESYLRKNVVPREYRKYFPDVMKNHQSHDVLLLCLNCHQLSNLQDAQMRQKLSQMCSAPIGTEEDVKAFSDPQLRKVRASARALLYSAEKIPPKRMEELRTIVMDYCKCQQITTDVLKEIEEIEAHVLNQDYDPHGKKVVEYFSLTCGLVQLEKMWREHFINTMKPKHLPKLWSVNHNHDRLFQKLVENRVNQEDFICAIYGTESAKKHLND